MYVNSLNYFRGISIIFIVFGHCLGLADFTSNSIIGDAIQNLTLGGTSFFVFISGFLFHHIFYKKYDFKKFMIKKTKYVLVPYLILSTIPIAYLLIKICVGSILSSNTLSIQYDKLLAFPIFRHYFTGIGGSFIGYWYIPFIMIVFVMSSTFVRFIKLRLKPQIIIALFLLICSVFIHKALEGEEYNMLSVFQNVFYFLPIYLLGIISSEKKDILYSKIKGKEFYILCIALSLAVIQAYIGELGNYHKDPFTFGGIDLMIIQKILLCLFFMIFLNRFENYKLRFLEIIAANSFGVFFTHGIVIAFIQVLKGKLDFSFTSNSFITYCMVAFLVIFLSLITTLFIKRIFPNYSRYLVGS
jgi:surface polysaccharide O-acyltransferase-like enzyme